MALLEMNRHRESAPVVSQWVFDDGVGRISARDSYGNLVMALAVGPQFGPQLAAAFNAPGLVTPPYGAFPAGYCAGRDQQR